MKIVYEQALLDHMEKKGRNSILVELVEINGDLDMTELHVYLPDQKTRDRFVNKKNYRVIPTEHGEVLFPAFPLEIEETVTFGLKKVLFVTMLTYKGFKV